jgi:type II secretion system protein H
MKKGFNLVEMLVVISIIGILSAALVPTLSQYLPGVQLNGSARVLSADLREAQERTVTEQKQYLIRFNLTAAPKYYQLMRINNTTEENIRTVNLASSENVTLDPGISQNQITFSADGGPSSSGNITLSNTAGSKIVNVSPAGFIKIQ